MRRLIVYLLERVIIVLQMVDVVVTAYAKARI